MEFTKSAEGRAILRAKYPDVAHWLLDPVPKTEKATSRIKASSQSPRDGARERFWARMNASPESNPITSRLMDHFKRRVPDYHAGDQ